MKLKFEITNGANRRIILTPHKCHYNDVGKFNSFPSAKEELIERIEREIDCLRVELAHVETLAETDIEPWGNGQLQTDCRDSRDRKLGWNCGCSFDANECEELDGLYYDWEGRKNA